MHPHLSTHSWVAVSFFDAYAFCPVRTPDLVTILVGLLLWFAESARGTPACVLVRLCSLYVVYTARQYR